GLHPVGQLRGGGEGGPAVGGGGDDHEGQVPDGQVAGAVCRPQARCRVPVAHLPRHDGDDLAGGGVGGVPQAGHLVSAVVVADHALEGDDRAHGVGGGGGAGVGEQGLQG